MRQAHWGELSLAIGEDALRVLIEHYPGRRLYVARNPDEPRELSVLDRPTIERICDALAGQRITIPSGRQAPVGKVRVADVVNLTAKGLKSWEIAARLRCSVRTVHLKRAAHRREAGTVAFPPGLK